MFKRTKYENKEVSMYGIVDERTKAIVYQGDAYTARFMLFALLIDITVRGLLVDVPFINSNWDLMLIVIVGSFIFTAYQIRSKVIFNRPVTKSFIFVTVLIGLSALFAFIFTYFLK